MKKLLILFAIVFAVFVSNAEAKNRYGGGVNFNYFYGSLSPYGEWIEIDYDLYAWRPAYVSKRWAPYTVGRWVWTTYGWYWDSYEPFGWATYHYGRWHFDDYYGWIWIPDYEWAPAWVEWRYDDNYIGWAPLPPYAHYRRGVGIHFSIDFHFPVTHWHYVPVKHFHGYDVHRYMVKDKVKHKIHGKTKYRNAYDYRDGRIINRGIDRDFVERRGNIKIKERNIFETDKFRENRGNNNDRIEIFRPNENEINRFRNVERYDFKRSDRKSNLDVAKIERRETGISRDRNNDNLRNDRTGDRGKPEIRDDRKSNEIRKNDSRNENRNDVQIKRNEKETPKPNSAPVNKEREIKRNDNNSNSGNVFKEREVKRNENNVRTNSSGRNEVKTRENRNTDRKR